MLFLKQFLKSEESISNFNESPENTNKYFITIPYLGKDSRRFVNEFSKIIRENVDVKIIPIYQSFKVSSYFLLKSRTPFSLCSNVVYKFKCSCDTNNTYIGMSSRHIGTRIREHLNFNSLANSSIKDHIMACTHSSNIKSGLNSFSIIRQCRSEFHTKIHEALLIKKHRPLLNKQLYAGGASYLLQIF